MPSNTICKLCLKPSVLQKSHIIPNFIVNRLYDVEGKTRQYHELPTDINREVKRGQGGFFEKLLCRSCEQKVAAWEKYGREFLFGNKIIERIQLSERTTAYSGINYNLFKLFQLSILWKASVSTLEVFSQVTLGQFEEKARHLLENSDPGLFDAFPCILLRLSDTNNATVTDLIVNPQRTRFDGMCSYEFIMGGFTFLYIVTSHRLPEQLLPFLLKDDGTLLILNISLFERHDIKRMAAELKKQGKIDRAIRPRR